MNRQQQATNTNGNRTPRSLSASLASRFGSNTSKSPHMANILGMRTPQSSPKPTTLPRSLSALSPSAANGRTSGGRSTGLDAQVYTDCQSRGLTSRLAGYYEGERPIVNRLYSRAGEFPVVHIQRNEPIASPVRSKSGVGAMLSPAVRIPAPDRSAHYPSSALSIRSEIFRTGAMAGVGLGGVGAGGSNSSSTTSMATSTSSTTLASPSSAAVDDTATTSSAAVAAVVVDSYELLAPLDALKEISRKRIHCDEASVNIVDSVKKQRAEEESPYAAGGSDVRSAQSKRLRDKTSPTYSNSTSNGQQKRPRTRNNDVLSSLSSSVRHNTPIAKIRTPNAFRSALDCEASRALPLTLSPSTSLSLASSPKPPPRVQQQQQQQHPQSSITMNISQDDHDGPQNAAAVDATLNTTGSRYESMHDLTVPGAGSFESRAFAKYSSAGVKTQAAMELNSETSPKLTLFNKKYTSGQTTAPSNVGVGGAKKRTIDETQDAEDNDDNDDENDYDDSNYVIAYVKPRSTETEPRANTTAVVPLTAKTIATSMPDKRPVVGQKSKLALMLSCLSGDLDDDDDDDHNKDHVDSASASLVAASKATTSVPVVPVVKTIPIVMPQSTDAAIDTTKNGLDDPIQPNVAVLVSSNAPKTSEPDAASITTSATTTASTSALPATFSFGLKPTPAIATPATTTVDNATSIVSVPAADPKKKGGFSFDPSAGLKPQSNTAALPSNPLTAPSMTPAGNTTTIPTASSIPTFSFGGASGASAQAASPPKPTTVNFSFGGASVPTAASASNLGPPPAYGTNTIGSTLLSSAAGDGNTPTTSTNATASASSSAFAFGVSKIPVATFGSGSVVTQPSAVTTTSTREAAAATGPVAAGAAMNSFGFGPDAGGAPTSFGGAATTNAVVAPVAVVGGTGGSAAFSFGSIGGGGGDGNTVAKPSLLGAPSFGGAFATKSATIPTTTAAGQATFAFGAAAQPSTTVAQTSAVGSTAATATPFAFGASGGSGVNPPNQATNATTAVSGFGNLFGNASAITPATTASVSTNSAQQPVAAGEAKPFGFGGLSAFGSSAQPQQQQQSVFGANLAGAEATSAPPSFATSSTVFGSGGGSSILPAQPTAVFGAATAATPKPLSAFGSNSAATAGASTSVFGSSTIGSTFGNVASAASPPSFGSAAAAAPPSASAFGSSMFGAPAATTTTANGGGGNAAFQFGGGNTNNATANATPTFGQSASSATQQQQQQSSAFAFGGIATNNTNNTNSVAAASASSPFSFGGVTGASNIGSNQPQASSGSQPFAFGGGSSVAPPAVATGGNSNAAFSFGGAASKIPVALPSFGAGVAGNTSAQPAPFAFGQSSAPVNSGAGQQSPFAFGGAAAGAATASPAGSFQFTSPANLFSATPTNGGSAQAKGRQIRTARRVNK